LGPLGGEVFSLFHISLMRTFCVRREKERDGGGDMETLTGGKTEGASEAGTDYRYFTCFPFDALLV